MIIKIYYIILCILTSTSILLFILTSYYDCNKIDHQILKFILHAKACMHDIHTYMNNTLAIELKTAAVAVPLHLRSDERSSLLPS